MDWDRIIAIASLVVGIVSLYVGLRTLDTSKKIKQEVNQRITRGDFLENIDSILKKLRILYNTLNDTQHSLSKNDYYAVKEEMSILLVSYGDCLSPEAKQAITEERELVTKDTEKRILLDDDPIWDNKTHYRKKHAERLAILIKLLEKERKQYIL